MKKFLPLLGLFFTACSAGPNEQAALSDGEFRTICLGNHKYYVNGLTWQNNYAFAPKLTDDGKPAKCESEVKK